MSIGFPQGRDNNNQVIIVAAVAARPRTTNIENRLSTVRLRNICTGRVRVCENNPSSGDGNQSNAQNYSCWSLCFVITLFELTHTINVYTREIRRTTVSPRLKRKKGKRCNSTEDTTRRSFRLGRSAAEK